MEKDIVSADPSDPMFELPVENELLMMRLQAEFGAECVTGKDEIPPAVINEFLKSVYEFEQRFREPKNIVTIYQKIGKPDYVPSHDIPLSSVGKELQRVMALLRLHQLELDILGDYEDAEIYRFITEEFFGYEMEDIAMTGYIHHFCYEEFHPNHALDIRNRSTEFLTQWLNRGINEYSWQLGDRFIHPDTRVFTKTSVLKKIHRFFESYRSFSGGDYVIEEIKFEWNDTRENGEGYVRGRVRYNAWREGNGCSHFNGPFTLYLSNNNGWWSIFYFVFPGFSWNE